MDSEKILEYVSKEICQITKGLKLVHQIKLGSKDVKDNTRRDYLYTSRPYQSNSYKDMPSLYRLNIDTHDYLIMEYREGSNCMQIYFSYPHLLELKSVLKYVTSWFDERKGVFIYDDKEDIVFLNKKYYKEYIDTTSNTSRHRILFKPAIIERQDTAIEGVTVIVENECIFDLTRMEVFIFKDIIANFNLYESSLLLLNTALLSTNGSVSTRVPIEDNTNKLKGSRRSKPLRK
jgi:hypothetical protein